MNANRKTAIVDNLQAFAQDIVFYRSQGDKVVGVGWLPLQNRWRQDTFFHPGHNKPSLPDSHDLAWFRNADDADILP